MEPEYSVGDVGVLIGRFQVNRLHSGHREIIDYVKSKHKKYVIVLGISPLPSSIRNPLDFESRKQMIQTEYPDANIAFIHDVNNDNVWSGKLDEIINCIKGPNQTVTLYGSRDSFIPHYHGKHPTCKLDTKSITTGTEIRNEVRQAAHNSDAWRAGAIWASYNRYHPPRS